MNTSKSQELFAKASMSIPGGVNSPVRAFKAVGGNPLFIKKAKGAHLYDVDGNEYIDLIGSWGPMIMGHAFGPVIDSIREVIEDSTSFGAPCEREVLMAEQIKRMLPSIDKVRMVNSGTEACMSAIRAARGYTGRKKILKFEGCYHGHGDSFLIAAGSGAATMGQPDSLGVTQGVANDTLTCTFNDIDAVKSIMDANFGEIACIILEPVVGNMGCVPPQEGFLKSLRELCTQHGIVLIFDEVMTGFRLSAGGAQALYDIQPDLTTLGKIIGGGLPVGAYGGKEEIMNCIAPVGKVYQAGTLSGNPVAMAAGLTLLSHLERHPEVYVQLQKTTGILCNEMSKELKTKGIPHTINQVGSMYSLFFTSEKVVDFESAKSSNLEIFARYFRGMLQEGIYLAPSQFESLFVSYAIGDTERARILEAHKKVIARF